MNRPLSMLARFSAWWTSERIAAAFSAFYGLYIWVFSSFGGSSAFQALSVGITAQGIPPEPVFALPLLLGAVILVWGDHRDCTVRAMLGLMMSFSVFCAALVSCLLTAIHSTGVPAYIGIAGMYLVLTIRRATGTPHAAP